ncbi:MAG: NTP transferase domain-containing protein [Nitrospirales bacterium]
MKAIIFAAGVGRRLQAVTQGRPKCLVEIGGRSLLSLHLEYLTQMGVGPVVLVVGFAQEAIREAVAQDPHGSVVQFVVNEQFTRGSITSLWAARDHMTEDAVLMDADVFYDPRILMRLVRSSFSTALLMDETVQQHTEECMVAAWDGRVVRLSKTLPERFDEAGEGIGFFKIQKSHIPTLLHSVQSCIEAGRLDMEYEDAMQEFFGQVAVGYEKVGGIPWVEIDFPEDIQRATHEILPARGVMENNTSASANR